MVLAKCFRCKKVIRSWQAELDYSDDEICKCNDKPTGGEDDRRQNENSNK